MQNKKTILLFVILALGTFLRFYNLDWADGHFFHPDERNIAIAVSQLDFANGDYNPNFFAYGSLPIYLLYIFSGGDFEQSLLYGRIISAIFSSLSLVLIYKIAKVLLISILHRSKSRIENFDKIESYAILTTAVCAFSAGLIQFAHFTTFETFLLFEYLLFLYFACKLVQKPSWSSYIILAVITGVAIGTKIVSLFLLGVFAGVHFLVVLKNRKSSTNRVMNVIFNILNYFSAEFILSLIVIAAVFFATNPFIILDYEAFRGSFAYESSVATGSLVVFYTQQFQETVPFVYQFLYVFPSIVSWPVTVMGFLAFGYLIIFCLRYGLLFVFKNKFSIKLPLFIFLALAAGYGVSHFYMFVKWTRYMIPLAPFLIIATMLVLAKFSLKPQKLLRIPAKLALYSISLFAIIQGLNFFTIYIKPDPRLEASAWLAENSQAEDTFIGEVYDIGMIAFNQKLGTSRITEFDFYNLDDTHNESAELDELDNLLIESEYIIFPAERTYPTRARLPEVYPNGYEYQKQIFEQEAGFVKVAEFTRTTYLEDWLGIRFYSAGLFRPLNYDETFRVFDQPTITIFKKES